MLEHLCKTGLRPKRVAIIGASGFVGGAVKRRLEADGILVKAIGRNEVDLLSPDADQKLASLLAPDDVVVAASAIAPCRTTDMMLQNMVLARAIARAVVAVPVGHIINISSDAIYADSTKPLNEVSIAAPNSMHGVMHLARELIIKSETHAPIANIRPTLIFGSNDPHNGYGPNRFWRQVARGEEIVLFGEGEERRDHIFIDDVAELIAQVIRYRSSGALNAATGVVFSFREIAEAILAVIGKSNMIKGTPRVGPMPHNGLRSFDVTAINRAFPAFRFTPIEIALRRSQFVL